MTDEALRLLSLPFKTFSEETIGGAEQMGQGINAVRRGEPGSAAWNIGMGGLRAIGAPITIQGSIDGGITDNCALCHRQLASAYARKAEAAKAA